MLLTHRDFSDTENVRREKKAQKKKNPSPKSKDLQKENKKSKTLQTAHKCIHDNLFDFSGEKKEKRFFGKKVFFGPNLC